MTEELMDLISKGLQPEDIIEEEETTEEETTEEEEQSQVEEQEVEEEEYTQEELDYIISEATGVGSIDELNEKLALLEELQNNQSSNELVFENDFQKSVYEYVSKIPDITAEGATQLLAEVFFTNPEVANPRDLLALNYRIANPELTEQEASILFENEFEAKYPDLDDLSDLEKTRLSVEIRKAKEGINKFKQSNFVTTNPKAEMVDTKEAEAQQLREAAKWLETVDKSVSKIDTLTFPIEGGEALNYQIPDKSVVAQRAQTIDSFFSAYRDGKAEFDTNRFLVDIAKLANFDSILKEAYNHGKQQGVIEKTKEIAGIKSEISTQPQSPVSPAPKTNDELLADAALAIWGKKS